MNAYVFIGPSLGVADARQHLDATYLPPVAMGDVLRALAGRPAAIGIIDGVFETVPAVWHKEILFALSQGVRVYGASSMGALRAAELHSLGMRGIGRIFEDYRDGVLEDDDEVAVAHHDAAGGFRPLCDPLVNIRAALARAESLGLLTPQLARQLLDSQKARFYPDRSWHALLQEAHHLGVPAHELEALRQAVPRPPNIKRADAIELLQVMRRDFEEQAPAHDPQFAFEPTYYWGGLVAFEAAAQAPQPEALEAVTVSAIGRHVRLKHPDREGISRDALFSFLVYHEAKRCGLLPEGLQPNHPALAGTSRSLPPSDWSEFGQLCGQLTQELIETLRSRLDTFIALELSKRGELTRTLTDIEHKTRVLRARGSVRSQLGSAGVDLERLSQWYEQRFTKPDVPGDVYAHRLGFASWEEFIGEVVAEYVVETECGRPAAGLPGCAAAAAI
jgi:hypothetical protein